MASAPATRKKAPGAPSKYAPLSKLVQKGSTGPLLRAAQQRASELNVALAKLERQTSQYQEQRELKREARGLTDMLLKERNQLARLLKSASKELETVLERLQPFDDAAAKLKEAGMRDIPHLYATGVTQGKIHTASFFNTYMNDAVRNVHQATHHTCMPLASNPGCRQSLALSCILVLSCSHVCWLALDLKGTRTRRGAIWMS